MGIYKHIYIIEIKIRGIFMEYTKDIILEIVDKKLVAGYAKRKSWTSRIITIIKQNQFIIGILTLLTILMVIDFVLVNSFLQLLGSIY